MAKDVVSRRLSHVTAFRDDVFMVKGSVVYFVGTTANDLIKVGYSDKFRPRFMQIASTSPVPVMVLGIMKFSNTAAAKKAEIAIHRMLTGAGRHSHGEWFRIPISGVEALAGKFAEFGVTYTPATDAASVVLDTTDEKRDVFYRAASPIV